MTSAVPPKTLSATVGRKDRGGPPQPQQQTTTTTIAVRQEGMVRSGPIPDADELAKYEQLLPGAADRIIAMAEKIQAQRFLVDDNNQAMQRKDLDLQEKQMEINRTVVVEAAATTRRNQWFAFAVVIAGMILSAWLIEKGIPAAGISLIFVEVAGVGGLFVYSEKKRAKNKAAD